MERELAQLPAHEAVYDTIDKVELEQCVDRALNELTPREKLVVRLRFGFSDGREWKIYKIARSIRLSSAYTRCILEAALQKLRGRRSVTVHLNDFL